MLVGFDGLVEIVVEGFVTEVIVLQGLAEVIINYGASFGFLSDFFELVDVDELVSDCEVGTGLFLHSILIFMEKLLLQNLHAIFESSNIIVFQYFHNFRLY